VRLRYTNEERDTNKNSVRRHSASNCGTHRGTKTKVDNTRGERERKRVTMLHYVARARARASARERERERETVSARSV
jgi:hypothetical protein